MLLNDKWRHSEWLSRLQKRLKLAKRRSSGTGAGARGWAAEQGDHDLGGWTPTLPPWEAAGMTRRVRKRIQAGLAFEELLTEEFSTKEQRRVFEADVRAKLSAVRSMAPIDAARAASAKRGR